LLTARIALLAVVLVHAACSSSSGPTAPSPPVSQTPPTNPPATPPPAGPPTISITSAGVSPKEITVAVGARVLFVNNDVRSHELWGGPDHNNRDCPEVDVAGFLVAGQSRESGAFTRPQTCHFHDHTNYGNPAFEGRILVQ
jgi:hypothetical protein